MPTDSQSPAILPAKKRDPVISCLKGLGMVFIILIHLIDWSNIEWGRMGWEKWLKEILYVGPLWFIALSGTVVAIAYGRKPLWTATKRLWTRALQLVLIYYAYNIVKLFVFDFSTEPFYGLPEKSWNTVLRILSFQTFTVPITIILVIAAFLLISPIFLWLTRKSEQVDGHSRESGNLVTDVEARSVLDRGSATDGRSRIKSGMTMKQGTLLVLTILSAIPAYVYVPGTVEGPILRVLFSEGYVLYPFLLWLPCFFIGFLWGDLGWSRMKGWPVAIAGALTLITLVVSTPSSFFLSANEFPLRPYYLWTSFLALAVFAQAFTWLTRRENKPVQKTITFLAWLGDKSLLIYIGHWIVIDLTLWAFAPQWWVIWVTVLVFILASSLWSRRTKS